MDIKEVYGIECTFIKNNEIIDKGMSPQVYKDLDNAIEFCLSRLNANEQKKRLEQIENGDINKMTFISENYTYKIKFLRIV